MSFSRSLFLVLVALQVSIGACSRKVESPNIVLIFVDDMGYGDLACYGNESIKTPNIDRLAAHGQRWTSFYSSGSSCVPSRIGLMSGRHPSLLEGEKLVASRDHLMPAMLKKRGYSTAILGKWHLAGYSEDFVTSPMHPMECGFDYYFGTPGSNDVVSTSEEKPNRAFFDRCDATTLQVPLIRGREVIEMPVNQELLTSRYTSEAVAWIGRNKGSPFFLYLAHNMPHAPVFASERFQGKSKGGRYGDVIEEIDWSVGEVMRAVEEAGIEEKTLVVFTSDNGPWSMFEVHGGSAGPFRGEKGTSWEGGFRVPAIFYWKGAIQTGVNDGFAANLDLYATFVALVGGDEPIGLPGYISEDLTATLLNGAPSPRTRWLFGGGAKAFRSGKYKIHRATRARSSNPETREREPLEKHNPPLLFDLESDPGERHDIAAEHPERVSELLEEMRAFQAGR